MSSPAPQNSPWIKSPAVDLIFFSFGWVVIFFAYLWVDQTAFVREGRWFLVSLALLLAVIHRHLTFPLVYGDPAQFKRRKKTYLYLPLGFLLLTAGSLLYVQAPSYTTEKLPFPVHLNKGDALSVVVMQGAERSNTRVRFKGSEENVYEVAKTFNEALQGTVLVQARDGALKFSMPEGNLRSRFYLRGLMGKGLRNSLGIPKGTVTSWSASRPVFIFLLVLSALWNFYHTLMQKIGVLRIYSRKAGYGKPLLDKAVVWVWFAWLFFQLASMVEVRQQVERLAMSGKYLTSMLSPLYEILPVISKVLLVVALAITALYIMEEVRNRGKFHLPKNLFLGSILMIYATFFYDFLVGFVVFGISHAVEYLAFVNIFSRRKFQKQPATSSLMARLIRHQSLYFSIFVLASCALFIPWYFTDRVTLNFYIVGSSFLHFLYDGWIWKVRDPKVGQPLGIEYQKPPQLQPA